MSHHQSSAFRLTRLLTLALFLTVTLGAALNLPAHAAPSDNSFSLQVTPSPLVTTLKPGQTTDLELKIRNGGTTTENLKIEPRAFTTDPASGAVALSDKAPVPIGSWVSFSAPNFSIPAGEWYTQSIHIALPKDTGFSYSFALVISRQKEPDATNAGRLIKGSVAVFTLINVDRPGATRTLDVTQFTTSKHVYEYLPAKIQVKIKNTGNSIVQPFGNVFIQRSRISDKPIDTLLLNDQQGYIIPKQVRTFDLVWNKGFPNHVQAIAANGAITDKLTWKWTDLSNFRIGRYTAKLVLVYNDGARDVPIESEVSFWVIPWKIILGATLLGLLVLAGLWFIIGRIVAITRRKPKA